MCSWRYPFLPGARGETKRRERHKKSALRALPNRRFLFRKGGEWLVYDCVSDGKRKDCVGTRSTLRPTCAAWRWCGGRPAARYCVRSSRVRRLRSAQVEKKNGIPSGRHRNLCEWNGKMSLDLPRHFLSSAVPGDSNGCSIGQPRRSGDDNAVRRTASEGSRLTVSPSPSRPPPRRARCRRRERAR
jgi:hypothetical protein